MLKKKEIIFMITIMLFCFQTLLSGQTGTNTVSDSYINIAKGKPVIASSSYAAAYSADKACDDNATTVWGSNTTDSQAWLIVDLGEKTFIDGIGIDWYTSYYAKSFDIGISSDNKTWIIVSSVTNGQGGSDNIFTSAPCRYVGILCKSKQSVAYGITEFKVYKKTTVPTPTPIDVAKLHVIKDNIPGIGPHEKAYVRDNLAFIMKKEQVTIYNIENTDNPQVLTTIVDDATADKGDFQYMQVHENLLILNTNRQIENTTEHIAQLYIYDITDPKTPVLKHHEFDYAEFRHYLSIVNIEFYKDMMYILYQRGYKYYRSASLKVYNISNTERITLLKTKGVDACAFGMIRKDTALYINTSYITPYLRRNYKLKIFSLDMPADPQEVSSELFYEGNAFKFMLIDDLMIMASETRYLHVNISNLLAPTVIKDEEVQKNLILVDGNNLYTSEGNILQVTNYDDITTPVLLKEITLPGVINSGSLSGRKMYISQQTNGISILGE